MTENQEQDQLYLRHNTLNLSVPREVFIVGCGGTGAHTAIICAMIGVQSIHLADDDIVEAHNLSRLPFPYPDSIGKKKTEALKDYIKVIRPECEVLTHGGIYNESDLCVLIGEVIFDCNDDHKIQKMLNAFCKETNMKYVSVGCNANHITIKSDISKLWGNGETSRYEVTPMFIVPAMLSALVAVWSVVKKKNHIDVLKSISDMFTDKLTGASNECQQCPNLEHCVPCQEHPECGEFVPCSCCPIELS